MNDDKKYADACRICLDLDSKEYVSLFENYEDNSLVVYVNIITNVGIIEGDGFPDKICLSCLLELKTAIQFKEKCEKSDLILRSRLQLCKSEYEDALIKECKVEIKEDLEEKTECPLTEYLESDAFEPGDLSDADTHIEIKNINQTPKSRAIDLKLECHDCGGIFKSKCKLRVHWKKVHTLKYFICDKCKLTFKTLKAHRQHMLRNPKNCQVSPHCRIEGEGRNRIFHCKDCDYQARRANEMSTHILIHTGARPHQCDKCHKAFTQLSTLNQHKENEHREYKLEITCQYCGKFIQGYNKVNKHLKRHTASSVQCDICKKVLKAKIYLKSHMLRHSGIKNYMCKTCGALFYTLVDLINHTRKKHLKKHTTYPCDKCEYKATTKKVIMKHKSKHTGTNFVCTVCGTFYDDKQRLAVHQKVHFEKNQACPYCTSRYHRRDSLAKHIKQVHKLLHAKEIPVVVKQERKRKSPRNNEPEDLETGQE